MGDNSNLVQGRVSDPLLLDMLYDLKGRGWTTTDVVNKAMEALYESLYGEEPKRVEIETVDTKTLLEVQRINDRLAILTSMVEDLSRGAIVKSQSSGAAQGDEFDEFSDFDDVIDDPLIASIE